MNENQPLIQQSNYDRSRIKFYHKVVFCILFIISLMANAGMLSYIVSKSGQCSKCPPNNNPDNGNDELYQECLKREADYINQLVVAKNKIIKLQKELENCKHNSTSLTSELKSCKADVKLLNSQLQKTKEELASCRKGTGDCGSRLMTCLTHFHSCQHENLDLSLKNQRLNDSLNSCNTQLSDCKSKLPHSGANTNNYNYSIRIVIPILSVLLFVMK